MIENSVPKNIQIKNQIFVHVKTRLHEPVMIFKNTKGNLFLRIGPKKIIKKELQLHTHLLTCGFPVPAIVSEGARGSRYYFIETSLGDAHIGDFFIHDCETKIYPADTNFNDLITISAKVASVQLGNPESTIDNESLYLGLHVDSILEELPYVSKSLLKAFEKFKINTAMLPRVVTHGDFNPYNFFKAGMIDFGSMHQAPAGYDIVTNIYHTYNFPQKGNYEILRTYNYSQRQINRYFIAMDTIYKKAGAPPVSNFIDDFIFARSIWSTARMHKYPKLQKWRYGRFGKLVKGYLAGSSLKSFVAQYPD